MAGDVKETYEVMAAGSIMLYPADTIWGIGRGTTNEKAVQRMYELERRADNKAMLVLMNSETRLDRCVSDVPDIARDSADVPDKPLITIYSSAKNLATNLLRADGNVGIHVTSEEFSKKLYERSRKPLVSTSANISGEPSPTNFSEISEVIKEGVDYIVGYRQDDMSKAASFGVIRLGIGGLVQVIRQE